MQIEALNGKTSFPTYCRDLYGAVSESRTHTGLDPSGF